MTEWKSKWLVARGTWEGILYKPLATGYKPKVKITMRKATDEEPWWDD